MGRPQNYLGEGQMTLLGGIVSELGIEMPDFNSYEEWEKYLDQLIEKHVVQVSKYGWTVIENKEQFLEERADLEEEEDSFDEYVFDMSDY